MGELKAKMLEVYFWKLEERERRKRSLPPLPRHHCFDHCFDHTFDRRAEGSSRSANAASGPPPPALSPLFIFDHYF